AVPSGRARHLREHGIRLRCTGIVVSGGLYVVGSVGGSHEERSLTTSRDTCAETCLSLQRSSHQSLIT
ncbi:MAG: hypothetical protein ACK559_29785, partial [bacterium]